MLYTHALVGNWILKANSWFQNGSLGQITSVEQNFSTSSLFVISEYLLTDIPIVDTETNTTTLLCVYNTIKELGDSGR